MVLACCVVFASLYVGTASEKKCVIDNDTMTGTCARDVDDSVVALSTLVQPAGCYTRYV
jgi:hypothetical protein